MDRVVEFEVAESQVPTVKISPKSLTPQEVEAHQASGHVQYRSWCRYCVTARGIGHQHRSSVKYDETKPTVSRESRHDTDFGGS